MSTYSTNEFKAGLKVIIDNDPYSILENEFVKPGKGQAFVRTKFRNLKTQRVIEKTLKSGDTLEGADVVEVEAQYLYGDGQHWHFMSPASFEQFSAEAVAVQEATPWIKEQDMCTMILWNGQPLSVAPPIFVVLKIVETDPGIRGDTSGGGTKPARLETGAVVKIPLFIQEGELIKVDTRTGEYVSRVKE